MRVTIELSETGYDALDRIQRVTDASTKADTIRDALALYELAVDKAEEGHGIFVGPTAERAVEIVIPALRRARAKSKPKAA